MQASAVQLQTEDAKNSVTLQNKLVNDLPLVVGGTVRTPFDLAAITPDAKNLGGDNGFMLGGGQAASYGTSLDGVSTNTQPRAFEELGRLEFAFGGSDRAVHGGHQRISKPNTATPAAAT